MLETIKVNMPDGSTRPITECLGYDRLLKLVKDLKENKK